MAHPKSKEISLPEALRVVAEACEQTPAILLDQDVAVIKVIMVALRSMEQRGAAQEHHESWRLNHPDGKNYI